MRIAALWEGTTQIQALDLLGRKIMLQKLRPINEHCAELYGQCKPLLFSSDAQLRSHAWSLLACAAEWQLLTYRIGLKARADKEWISSSSVDYLMYSGYVSLASHWLQMESVAAAALASGEGAEEEAFYTAMVRSADPLPEPKPGEGAEEDAFYTAKRQTSAFVFARLLPRTRSHKDAMLS